MDLTAVSPKWLYLPTQCSEEQTAIWKDSFLLFQEGKKIHTHTHIHIVRRIWPSQLSPVFHHFLMRNTTPLRPINTGQSPLPLYSPLRGTRAACRTCKCFHSIRHQQLPRECKSLKSHRGPWDHFVRTALWRIWSIDICLYSLSQNYLPQKPAT